MLALDLVLVTVVATESEAVATESVPEQGGAG